MNYYEHHIGDYAEATAHLSFIEDAAYSRMIRKYYSTEKPLPADLKAVQRLVGARSKEDRDAVQVVLDEFFTLTADGWRNKRCDEVIAAYLEKSGKARRSAQARWGKTQSDGNANASETQCERMQNASTSHHERNALQSPIPSNQSPEEDLTARNLDTAPQGETSPRAAVGGIKTPTPEGEMATALRDQGVYVTSQLPTLLAWLRDGFTTAQLLEATALARMRKPWPEKIPASYLDAIIRQPQRTPLAVVNGGKPIKYRTAEEVEAEELARGDAHAQH